jgi:hypothetical protein
MITALLLAFATAVPARAESQLQSLASKGEAPEASQLETLTGSYRFIGGQAEIDALEAAIDDVVSDMNLLARGIARRRLRKASEIPAGLAISLSGRVLTVMIADAAYSAPLDGTAVKVRGPSGDSLMLRHRVLGKATLWQQFAGDDGIRVNTCERMAGKRMRVRVTIRSEKLPKALAYSMTFAREG